MNSFIRRLLATLAVSFAVALPASATSYSTDYTDLWWNSAENGWGMNIVQQYDALFATLYVYGADGTPRWYFASGMTGSPTSFSGGLFSTTGSPFSGAWTGLGPVTQVGTMTINFTGPNAGTLVYSVNGQTITKQMTRNTFRNNVVSGNFLGGMAATASSCGNSANNGGALIYGALTVSQNGGSVSFRVDFYNNTGLSSTCIFSGPYTAEGRLGRVSGGTMTCTQGSSTVNQGTFSMTELDVGANGMSSRFTGSDQFCSYNGRFGGLRDVP
jgi:hypothetical protein